MKINFNNILCATDLSDLSGIAISSGVALAREFNAKLYICHVVDLSTTAAYGDIIFAPLELQNKSIGYTHEQLEFIMQKQNIDWTPLVTAGHPSDEISKFVAMHQIDLVVAATHGRSGLIRSSEGLDIQKNGAAITFKKILVGCDFSSFSDLAFRYGLSLAQDFESELHLIHVIETPIYKDILKTSTSSGNAPETAMYEQLNAKLSQKIPDESANWCQPKTSLLAGRPYEEIIKYARLNSIDLIILGVRGRNLIEVLLTGSTTDRIVRQGPCPVLSVCPIRN